LCVPVPSHRFLMSYVLVPLFVFSELKWEVVVPFVDIGEIVDQSVFHVTTVNNGHVTTVNNGHVSTVNNGHITTVNNGHITTVNNGHITTVKQNQDIDQKCPDSASNSFVSIVCLLVNVLILLVIVLFLMYVYLSWYC
jgi:hypothetical protein